MCTTTLVLTFLRSITVEVGAVVLHLSSPNLLVCRRAGHTTLAGCKFFLVLGKIYPNTANGFRDNAHGRVFQTELPDNQALTIESCIASCASQNFTLAGAEYGVQCCTYDFRSIPASCFEPPLSQSAATILYRGQSQLPMLTAIWAVVVVARKPSRLRSCKMGN
jgi:hypothetical protein